MAFKVFLSYSTDPEENAIVWRLQTLAASHGVQMFVPQRAASIAPSPRRNAPSLSEDVRSAIRNADCVLALITRATGPVVEKELNYALAQHKVIVPIVELGVGDPGFLAKFPRVFNFSRFDGNPGKLESEILGFLRHESLNKQNRQAVGALVAIGLSLLLLSGLTKK